MSKLTNLDQSEHLRDYRRAINCVKVEEMYQLGKVQAADRFTLVLELSLFR